MVAFILQQIFGIMWDFLVFYHVLKATVNSLCVEEGLGALQAERRKDLLEVRVVVVRGREGHWVNWKSSGEGLTAEERAAQLNVWKVGAGTKRTSRGDAEALDSRRTISSLQSCVMKPHKDYVVVFGLGNFYQREADETL